MGLYIQSVERVKREGRPIEIGSNISEMNDQLKAGERAAAIATRRFGKVALLIAGAGDWHAVKSSGCDGLYAVSAELAKTAQ